MACKNFEFTRNKKLKTHKVSGMLDNENARNIVYSVIFTDTRVRLNNPNIVIFDKKEKLMTILEVGTTSQIYLITTGVEIR